MKPIPFEIRSANPSDADDIADAHRDSIHSIGPLYYLADTVGAWGSGLTADQYVKAMEGGEVFFIAVGDSASEMRVLGFSSYRVDDDQHGTTVYVRGSAARRGVGSALYRSAETAARSAGATSLHIDASLAAVAFYKAHGFEEVGRGEHRLQSGTPMACVFMRKQLRPN